MTMRGRSFWETKVGIVFVMGLGLVALPLALPWAMIGVRRSQLRLQRLVDEFPCIVCGGLLGAEALLIANGRWAQEVEKRRAASPDWIIMRMIRHVHAVCPHCGCEYTYRDRENALARHIAPGAELLS